MIRAVGLRSCHWTVPPIGAQAPAGRVVGERVLEHAAELRVDLLIVLESGHVVLAVGHRRLPVAGRAA